MCCGDGKERAIVATARKLAVLLHHLWVSGEVYEPLHNSRRTTVAAAAYNKRQEQPKTVPGREKTKSQSRVPVTALIACPTFTLS